jgi:ABC-type branched-subunit amino acid transport system ATPase component
VEILKIEGISKHFGGVVAVESFSMVQSENQITGIIGPNGAGKTTVFNLITGAASVDQGRILFMDREITKLPAHRRTDLGIARTFQNIRLFGNLTVLDNMKVAHDMKVRYTLWEEMLRLPRVRKQEREIDEKARHFLAYLGLEDYAAQKPQNLSYGIQRRLELARTLMTEPRILLLDEPAAGLNPHEVRALMDTIRKIQEENALTIVIVEHHMELIMNVCSLIHVLDFGKKIAEGEPAVIKKNEQVLQAYLGEEV